LKNVEGASKFKAMGKGGTTNLKVRGSMHWKVGGVNTVKTIKLKKGGSA